MSKEIMSAKELSGYLGIGITKVYQMIEHKEIPASKIGGQYKFLKSAVDKWLETKIITNGAAASNGNGS